MTQAGATPDPKNAIITQARGSLPAALEISHDISDNPELAFEESRAAGLLTTALEQRGFAVVRPIAGLDTAFDATFGDGHVNVGLFAEYDALPNVGHACGHNVIAAAAFLAAVALQPVSEQLSLRLHVFGTPAEEGGGGKVTMLEAGVFDTLDFAMMVHPAPHDMVAPAILAMTMRDVEYEGFTPPSMNPERGRSAADAATLTQVGIGLLRQHMRSTDRISGYISEAGFAANVLPDRARLRFVMRASTMDELDDLASRFGNTVAGAATATGTTAAVTVPHPPYDAMRHDPMLRQLYEANARELGRTFPDATAENNARSASTDFANVSQRIPSIHPLIGIDAAGFSNHQAGFADRCRGESGDQAVFDGAVAMAWTIYDYVEHRRGTVECRN